MRFALAPAQHADALLLLREVDELEVGGEGLDDVDAGDDDISPWEREHLLLHV